MDGLYPLELLRITTTRAFAVLKYDQHLVHNNFMMFSFPERAFDRAFHFEADSGPKSLTPGLNKVS